MSWFAAVWANQADSAGEVPQDDRSNGESGDRSWPAQGLPFGNRELQTSATAEQCEARGPAIPGQVTLSSHIVVTILIVERLRMAHRQSHNKG